MKAIFSIVLSIFTIVLLFLNQEVNRQMNEYTGEIRKLRRNLDKIKNFSEIKTIVKESINPIMEKVKNEKGAEKNLINFYREYKDLFNLHIINFIQKRGNYLSLKVSASINRSDLETFFTFFTIKKENGFLNINSLSTSRDSVKIEFDIIEMYK